MNLESTLESYLASQCKAAGVLCLKLRLIAGRGFPDRTLIGKPGRIAFVELKKERTGRLSANQKKWIKRLQSFGFRVEVVETKAEVDQTLKDFQT